MGPQVETIIRAALADLAEDQGALLNGIRWVNERYADLCARRLKQRRRVAAVTIPAAVTTGTATITHGSPIVDFDATGDAFLDLLGSSLRGRFFQVQGGPWYEIAAWSTVGFQLTLATPVAEATAASLAYRIVTRTVSLADDAGFLGTFAWERRQQPLDVGSVTELDSEAPGRPYATTGPSFIADAGESQDKRIVEIYPYSTTDEVLRYVYWSRPSAFELQDHLPSAVFLKAMKEGVLADVMRWKMGVAMNNGKLEEAALWRNEYRTQEKIWEREVMKLAKVDQGIEDISIILRSRFIGMPRSIRTARDEVWSRG